LINFSNYFSSPKQTETENLVESFRKGQVGVGGIAGINSFSAEIAYLDTKYNFDVELLAPDVYKLTINGNSIEARVTETAEGALLATFGGETHRIFGMEEALGLRLVLDGSTILMPTIFDPSELRTDVTGKVVRYLQDNGASVDEGEPYVEVEAMKMIMPLKASESGAITHNLSPGSVISAGDLLASLTLKDPSKVKKILSHEGALDIPAVDLELTAKEKLQNILSGYSGDPEAIVSAAFSEVEDFESATALVTEIINEFLSVETMFDGLLLDDVVRDMTKANAESLGTVVSLNLAHQQLAMRSKVVSAVLRQVETLSGRYGMQELPSDLEETLNALSALKSKAYGELTLAASSIVRESKVPAFETRLSELRETLSSGDSDLISLSQSPTLSAGVDLLTSLFSDEDAAVRERAVEVYVRRVYRTYRIDDIKVEEIAGRLTCTWTFSFADVPVDSSVPRKGLLSVIPSAGDLESLMPAILDDMSGSISDTVGDTPVNVLHIASKDSNFEGVEGVEGVVVAQTAKLNMLGIRTVNLLVPVAKKDPSYYTFLQCDGFKESPIRRDMRPTFHHLLELSRLSENFSLDRFDAIGKNAQVYIGSEITTKPMRGPAPQVLFVRGISHTPGIVTAAGARRSLLAGLDELERAQSNSKVTANSSSRIFLHSLPELTDITPEALASNFEDLMGGLKSRLATRLLKLRVDEIEVKVRIATTDENGQPLVQPVRLIASSMDGEWLKTAAYIENADPVTGVSKEYYLLGDGTDNASVLDPYGTSSIVQTKRAIARRVGSTYAYDFLGLLEVGLIGEWDAHIKAMNSADLESNIRIPDSIFSSQEFIMGDDGELALGARAIGTNKVGMVAWLVNMKTPEYPDGRDVVFISNDVTVQSGSFGVPEDEVYFKASQYARDNKLPRVYIACNAGARIGLVDDLKPKFNIKFSDENAPQKGFDYLYLSDDDYSALPEGAVNAHKVDEGWAIDDIIGTAEGIGVENLRGSGMIAGETSKAYDEIFTLSYVTGRSVGIGAYLVRLGQRIIQMKQGPMILTGYSALNKLLGKAVYNSQDQLGGPQVMVPNGVTHEQVENDQDGVASILKWLSFVPKNVGALPASRSVSDPVERDVEWRPTPTPYDPRLMLSGTPGVPGFFDEGSFKEYLAGWGKSVVIGRGRLGGIPFGAVAVETRLVEQVVPADPADPNSREAILPQAGQVLFPDSSYKTAQAIKDFGKEGLPIMLFANWRGFSGGSRDMAGEILKFGAMIVDALREYENPVYIYLPPHGELRGGSWVVVDPTINEEKMSMFADPDSRGGILEPAGIIEIKFREADQIKAMHRIDPQLQLLDAELDGTELDTEAQDAIKEQVSIFDVSVVVMYSVLFPKLLLT